MKKGENKLKLYNLHNKADQTENFCAEWKSVTFYIFWSMYTGKNWSMETSWPLQIPLHLIQVTLSKCKTHTDIFWNRPSNLIYYNKDCLSTSIINNNTTSFFRIIHLLTLYAILNELLKYCNRIPFTNFKIRNNKGHSNRRIILEVSYILVLKCLATLFFFFFFLFMD